jgi:isopentenyl diphosphate isomerase/L-lactate dehydrogenase-like FMN-dependent dehydrogenase
VAVLWEAVDRLGRTVRMTDAAWQHVQAAHNDRQPRLAEIRDAVTLAEEVRRDRRFARRAVHYGRVGAERLRLRVIVNYRPEAQSGWIGEVVTAFFTERRYPEEVVLWP